MRNVALLLMTAALAQAQQPPQPLPPEVTDPPTGDKGSLVRFDPQLLIIKRIENRHQLWAGQVMLKDFGLSEGQAREAIKLVRDMRFTQYGTIPGSLPVFEFWLSEGEAVKGGLAVRNVIPFNAAAVQLENVGGAFVIRDDKLMLYNFGSQKEAAQQALAVLKKYGFNQLGIVGTPSPSMTYLTVDPYARPPQSPVKGEAPTKEIAFQVSQQGLVLPEIGYAGTRTALDPKKFDVARNGHNWVVVHSKDVIGSFGPNMNDARMALRMIQDSRITEVCHVGRSGFPVYLAGGQPPRGAGLGFNNLRIKPAGMKVQVVNNVVCLTEEGRIIFEFGSSYEDAELVLKVLRYFKFDQISPIGDLKLMIKTK